MKGDGHILIVDDEASLRQTLARILQRADYEVTTTASGTEALRLLSEHPFDLVYLDIRMPDVSGLEVLKTFRGSAAVMTLQRRERTEEAIETATRSRSWTSPRSRRTT